MTPTAKERKARLLLWAEALESGEFTQGDRRLRRATEEYCCLGVVGGAFEMTQKREPKSGLALELESIRDVVRGLNRLGSDRAPNPRHQSRNGLSARRTPREHDRRSNERRRHRLDRLRRER